MNRRPRPRVHRDRPPDRGNASLNTAVAVAMTVLLATATVPVLRPAGEQTADTGRDVVCRVLALFVDADCGDGSRPVGVDPDAGLVAAEPAGKAEQRKAEEVTKRVMKAPPAAVQACLDGGQEYLAGIRDLGVEIVRQMLTTELELLPAHEALAPAWEDVKAFVANPFDYKTALKDPARWLCAQLVGVALTGGAGRLAGAARATPRTLLRDSARRQPRLRQRLPDCLPNSFTGGTPVLLADGSAVPIARVRVGDRVLAADPRTGVRGPRAVTAVIERTGVKALVDVTVRGRRITATAGHPFWVPGARRWVDAGDLDPGTVLRTAQGRGVGVTHVRARSARVTVHNLTVDDLHTYHVLAGRTAVLVHNADCNPPKSPNQPNQPRPPRRPGGSDPAGVAAALGSGELKLGRAVGSGFYGDVFPIAGRADLAVKVLYQGGDAALDAELAALNRIRDLGIPTAHISIIEWVDPATKAARRGLLQRFIPSDVGTLVSAFPGVFEQSGVRVTAQTVADLRAIRGKLKSGAAVVDDFQFLVERGTGKVTVIDAQGVKQVGSGLTQAQHEAFLRDLDATITAVERLRGGTP